MSVDIRDPVDGMIQIPITSDEFTRQIGRMAEDCIGDCNSRTYSLMFFQYTISIPLVTVMVKIITARPEFTVISDTIVPPQGEHIVFFEIAHITFEVL